MKRRLFLFWISLILLCIAACGCGDDDDSGDDDVQSGDDSDDSADDDDNGDDDDDLDDDTRTVPDYPESCADGPVFSFTLRALPMTVPYPNDLYTVEDAASPSGRRVHIDNATALPFGALVRNPNLGFLRRAYNNLTGFSTLADLYVPVGTEPDADSLPDETEPAISDGVFLIDGAGNFAHVRVEWRAPDLHLTPWFPLKENTHYTLIATRALRPPGGCYQASEDMQAVWKSWAEDGGARLFMRYTAMLDRFDGLGLLPDQILSVADFTTGWVTHGMQEAKSVLDELAAADPPAFRDWEIAPGDDPRLFATAHATFDVPIFKPDGAPWNLDAQGRPIVDHAGTIRAYFTLPAADANPGGQPYPILIFEHGMFNEMHEIRPPFTTEIAAQGFAMVAVDAICHGERLPPGTGEVGQFLCFYNIFDPESWRDNFRESAANVLWLALALASLADTDLDENGIPDFDTTRIYNLGASFGSIVGGTFAALAPEIEAHVLAASGAKLTSIVQDGEAAEYFDIVETIDSLIWPNEPVTDFLRLFMDMLQAVMDPADSANFAAHVANDPLPVMGGYRPQVLQQGSAYDDTIGGPPGGWLCRAGGWPQIEPFVWDAGVSSASAPFVGSAYYQFDTDEHTLIFDDHALGVASRGQVIHYFLTHRENGIGEIIDPLAGM